MKALEVESAEYKKLHQKYSSAAFRSQVESVEREAALRKSAFEASKRVAESFQADGKIEEFLSAQDLMKQLDPANKSPKISVSRQDPEKVRVLKQTWLEKISKLAKTEQLKQEKMARSYATALEPISAKLLKNSEIEYAKLIHDESLRLRKLYAVGSTNVAEGQKPAEKEPKLGFGDNPEPVEGHFYLVGEDKERWILLLNGKTLAMKDYKSEEISLNVGDIVVMRYPTYKGRALLLAFVSKDRTKAIHLRAKDLKLFGDENPRTISAKKIADQKKTLRAVDLSGNKKWKELDMVPKSEGGSEGMMYDWQGNHLIAFEVKEDQIKPMPRSE